MDQIAFSIPTETNAFAVRRDIKKILFRFAISPTEFHSRRRIKRAPQMALQLNLKTHAPEDAHLIARIFPNSSIASAERARRKNETINCRRLCCRSVGFVCKREEQAFTERQKRNARQLSSSGSQVNANNSTAMWLTSADNIKA